MPAKCLVRQEAVQHTGNYLPDCSSNHCAHSVGLLQHSHIGQQNELGEVNTGRETGIAAHLTSTVKSSDVTNVRSCLISKTLDQTRDKLEMTNIVCCH